MDTFKALKVGVFNTYFLRRYIISVKLISMMLNQLFLVNYKLYMPFNYNNITLISKVSNASYVSYLGLLYSTYNNVKGSYYQASTSGD